MEDLKVLLWADLSSAARYRLVYFPENIVMGEVSSLFYKLQRGFWAGFRYLGGRLVKVWNQICGVCTLVFTHQKQARHL